MVDKKEVSSNAFDSLAEDALSLLRIDIVLAGLYLTGIGLMFQATEQEFVLSVIGASYTQFSLHALFASMAACVLLYRKCKRISFEGEVPQNEIADERIQTLNLVTAAAFASFGSIVCFTLGILEAFAGVAPPISFPFIGLAFFVVLWILGPYSVLSVLDKVSEKNNRARQLIQIFI